MNDELEYVRGRRLRRLEIPKNPPSSTLQNSSTLRPELMHCCGEVARVNDSKCAAARRKVPKVVSLVGAITLIPSKSGSFACCGPLTMCCHSKRLPSFSLQSSTSRGLLPNKHKLLIHEHCVFLLVSLVSLVSDDRLCMYEYSPTSPFRRVAADSLPASPSQRAFPICT